MKFLNTSSISKYSQAKSFYFLYSLLFFCFFSLRAQDKTRNINLIIDADTANEVDDLYAVVRAVLEPNFNLIAINSAQFHTSPLASENTVNESQQINEEIIRLMGVKGISLPLGSNAPLTEYGKPASSEASKFIIDTAHKIKDNKKLHIVVLGSCTNVASAILEDPLIIPKIKV